MSSIIKDSSIWESQDSFDVARKKDMSVRIGMVREAIFDDDREETRYMVEVFNTNNQMPISCVRMERFGGVYNYEEYTHQTFEADDSSASASKYAVRAGDVVLVAFINGDSREGIIIGGIRHPARPEELDTEEDGIAYKTEFNGILQEINSDGEYRMTFRGMPLNIADLDEPSSGDDISEPEYDEEIGTSYWEFDVTGGWTVNDNASEDPQSIAIDKENGTITVTSGTVVVLMDKAGKMITVTTEHLQIDSTTDINVTTTDFKMEASSTASIKSPKIAFGTDGVELLEQIVKFIKALGMVTPISPIGPCNPMQGSPQWPQVQQVQQAIDSIKGSL
jgi:hypothetical protein